MTRCNRCGDELPGFFDTTCAGCRDRQDMLDELKQQTRELKSTALRGQDYRERVDRADERRDSAGARREADRARREQDEDDRQERQDNAAFIDSFPAAAAALLAKFNNEARLDEERRTTLLEMPATRRLRRLNKLEERRRLSPDEQRELQELTGGFVASAAGLLTGWLNEDEQALAAANEEFGRVAQAIRDADTADRMRAELAAFDSRRPHPSLSKVLDENPGGETACFACAAVLAALAALGFAIGGDTPRALLLVGLLLMSCAALAGYGFVLRSARAELLRFDLAREEFARARDPDPG